MIFSEKKWNDAGELKTFIPVSSATSFENLQSSLSDAYELFVRPLLGDEMIDSVDTIYSKETPTDLETKLLHLCQKAVANLAFWYNFEVLNTSITDQGFQRQESDTFKNVYKYQADALKNNFRNKGFNALDEILSFLESNIETFADFALSPGYTISKTSIVRSAAEVESIYYINSSRIIFLRMKPFFKMIEETELRPILGEELYKLLLKDMAEGVTNIGQTTVEEFRITCAEFIVLRSVMMLMKATGNITDRGLYFSSLSGGKEGNGNETDQPVSADNLAMQLEDVSMMANRYAERVANFVQLYIPDYCKIRPSEVMNRDNDDKTSVWL